jgi:hypothetical protein
MMIACLSQIRRIKKWFFTNCFCQKKYSISTKIIHKSGVKDKLVWKTKVPLNSIILECFENEEHGLYKMKYKVFYPGEIYTKSSKDNCIRILNTNVESPWVWIGGSEPNGTTVDATSTIAHFIMDGNTIKLELLHELFPNIVHWTYVDFASLETIEFPIEGIQIKE